MKLVTSRSWFEMVTRETGMMNRLPINGSITFKFTSFYFFKEKHILFTFVDFIANNFATTIAIYCNKENSFFLNSH